MEKTLILLMFLIAIGLQGNKICSACTLHVQPSTICVWILPFKLLSIPAAAAQSTATCVVLQSMAKSASGVMCIRNSQCNKLFCRVTDTTILRFIRRATVTLLTCNQPAAVRLALYNPSNTVFLNQTIDRTTTIQAVEGVLSLVVRLDHLRGSIGLGVNA